MRALSATRSRIHDAAMRLFAERGVAPVSISDLAQAAAVARGTIYNQLGSAERLFERVASQLSAEMHQRVERSCRAIEDPAERLATGIRLFIRRTHEEPAWGAFLSRFALSDPVLREMLCSQANTDLQAGLAAGRYQLEPAQLLSALSLIASATLGSMFLVLEGAKTWRDAGSETAELVLRALGVAPGEACRLASGALPALQAAVVTNPEAR